MPAGTRTVSPGYLKALQAPLLAGASCPDLRLDPKAPLPDHGNRRFVEVYAHGENVVGRRLRIQGSSPTRSRRDGDLREDGPTRRPIRSLYVPAPAAGPTPNTPCGLGTRARCLPQIRELVGRIEPGRAIFGVRTLDEAIDASLDRPRSSAGVLAGFALTAMLLAAVGLYSLLAHFVHTRRQEIGVRMALGATPLRIVGGLVGGAGRLIARGDRHRGASDVRRPTPRQIAALWCRPFGWREPGCRRRAARRSCPSRLPCSPPDAPPRSTRPSRCASKLLAVGRAFARQPRGILVGALAECSAHRRARRHGRLAKLVAQPVGCGQRLLPALVLLLAEQIELVFAVAQCAACTPSSRTFDPASSSSGTARGPPRRSRYRSGSAARSSGRA